MKLTLYAIDEVHGLLEGLEDDELEMMVDEMSIFNPKLIMTAAYKSGNSDGREPLFKWNGVFDLHQMDKVVDILEKKLGIDVDDELHVKDMREPLLHDPDDIPVIHEKTFYDDYGVTLWEHQVECLNAVRSHEKGIVDASTSAGKTIMMSAICRMYDQWYPSISMTINEDVTKELGKTHELLGLDYAIINAKVKPAKRIELLKQHRHIIITKKLAMNMAEHLVDIKGVFNWDEVHINGEAIMTFVRECLSDCPIRVGMTGSLPNPKKDPLKSQLIFNVMGGGVMKEILPSRVMGDGHAATLDIRVVKLDDKTGKEKIVEMGEEWCWEAEEAHYANDERVAAIARFIDMNCPRNTLIIASRAVGMKLAALLECDFIDKDVKSEVRSEYHKKFDLYDDYRCVATPGTSGTGLSIDLIHYGVLIDAGENPAKAGQNIGRFLRKDNEGDKKDSAIVWDIYSNTTYGARQKTGRMAYYKQRGFTFNREHTVIEV